MIRGGGGGGLHRPTASKQLLRCPSKPPVVEADSSPTSMESEDKNSERDPVRRYGAIGWSWSLDADVELDRVSSLAPEGHAIMHQIRG